MNTYNYCVYLHRRKDNGEVYYVGSGVYRKRERHFNARSKTWHEYHSKYGTDVEVVSLGMTQRRARELESDYMEKHAATIINTKKPVLACNEFDIDKLKEYVVYDENSPTFLTWIKRFGMRTTVGKPAGSLFNQSGKRKSAQIKVFHTTSKIARVVYMLFNGKIDEGYVIDHIDGDTFNNNINNLRAVTSHENSLNRAVWSGKAEGLPNGISISNSSRFPSIMSSVSYLGHKKSRSFSILKYGYETALLNAIRWKSNEILRLGLPVSDRHFSLDCGELVTINEKSKTMTDHKYIYKSLHGDNIRSFYLTISAIKFGKSFSIKKYGQDEALRLAIQTRDEALTKANRLDLLDK